MNRSIAALPLALGVLATTLPEDAAPSAHLAASEALVLEAATIAWPTEPLDSPLPHTVFGEPVYEDHDDEHNTTRAYEGFTVYYDDEVLAPRWTAIKVTSAMADANSSMGRPGSFKRDSSLKDDGFETTVHDDYNNLPGSRDWARGHLVPFDDARGWGETVGKESFFTSNIAPQLQDHNSKGWLTLEEVVTEFARDYDVVWVYAGPVYPEYAQPFAPNRRVPTPEAFYKIVVSPGEAGSVDVLAFLMPHREVPRSVDVGDFLVSIDEVEEETGLDFLHELPDQVEELLEREVWDLWPDLELVAVVEEPENHE